jgi:beta-glucanase (GH16 family)
MRLARRVAVATGMKRSLKASQLQAGDKVQLSGTVRRTNSHSAFRVTKVVVVTPSPTPTPTATPTPTPTPSPTPSPSATPIWSDEFDGAAGAAPDASKWNIWDSSNPGSDELEYYRPGNVQLDGAGHLVITARRESYRGYAYTSGRLDTMWLFTSIGGRVEASIKLPAGQGLWPAFWMLGQNINSAGWPDCGELDIMENLGNDPATVYGSIHSPLLGETKASAITPGIFHTYAVSRTPTTAQISVDGVAYATYSTTEPCFSQPFFILLNLAVGGAWPGSPNAGTPFPATMVVDWVRVFS